MSFHISSDSLEEIHWSLLTSLLNSPDYVSAPRDKPIREMIAASFTLTDPRNRLIMSPARSVNYGFAVGELCWYLRGDRDLATMQYYNKRMTMFSDDGETINSAYGNRIFRSRWRDRGTANWKGFEESVSQFDNVISELKSDPHSRRAVIHINEPHDLCHAVMDGSKDVPCTMSLQLFIRDRRLHMHVLMRSNDVIWGLPYDVFSFTMLQESFLYCLQHAGVPVDDLGHYHHSVGSLHLYDTHFGLADMVSKELWTKPAPMIPFTLDDLKWLAHFYEPFCRKSYLTDGAPDSSSRAQEMLQLKSDSELTTLDWMVVMLADHRDKRVSERLEKEKS